MGVGGGHKTEQSARLLSTICSNEMLVGEGKRYQNSISREEGRQETANIISRARATSGNNIFTRTKGLRN